METGKSGLIANNAANFKSHHSGMETFRGPLGPGVADDFKSHHSGMETFATSSETGFIRRL